MKGMIDIWLKVCGNANHSCEANTCESKEWLFPQETAMKNNDIVASNYSSMGKDFMA